MTIQEYLDIVNKRFKSGISKEHSYRGDLETLIRNLVSGVDITNEPANVTDCGNPDYVITKGKIPVGYIEAKDLGKDLNSKQYKEQFTRYKKALDNLIITDYIWFQFYNNGELVHEIKIAEIVDNQVKPLHENFSEFQNLIKDFCTFIGQTIKSSKKLAEMMAAKARLLKNIIENALNSDEETADNSSLMEQFETFKSILIHDLAPKDFADIYAQTLAYGMFAARLHDTTLDDFSRYEAAELIPKSNPFLKKLFTYIAGPDIDERIKRTVDNLAEVFRATNVEQLLKNFGKSTQTQDPIIHFYETFLAEYDPKLRKARGVWYTPEPVVNFIVRAVDDILKSEFNLPQGLADTSKTKIKVKTQTKDKRTATGYKEVEQEVHKVQILDPATGTGTFLAEVVKFIYNKKFKAMQGAWSSYVDEHLIPRLNGFELLMASYSMAHLKLDMLLTETGYKTTKDQRFNIYLTNSLEEHHPDTGTLFSNWLSTEANEANHIKRDTPVMVVMGNPPYSGESSNKGKWIMDLMEDYKKEPGGKIKLNERNSKSINDDYVKFIRYGQFYIEKNEVGVLAYINPHGFIDNPTYRGMRWNLLKTYDKIFTIDLHGNSKKKETCPDGATDVNVFDIMQGVSINIFVKTGTKKKPDLGTVFHHDLYGQRKQKYNFLTENSLSTIPFNIVNLKEPMFYFVPKDFELEKDYLNGFAILELMPFKTSGIKTHDDKTLVSDSLKNLEEKTHAKYDNYEIKKSLKYSYRPFDNGFIYYDTNLLGRARKKTIYHLKYENIGLILVKQPQAANTIFYDCAYLTNCLTDTNMYRRGGPQTFPLYLYSPISDTDIFDNSNRKPNLNYSIVEKLNKILGLSFTNEKETTKNTFAPIDILDYIYAVLHSPKYRETYKEFLKIDFPRIPYPKTKEIFWQLVELGKQIREIHLLESSTVEDYITSYPIDGDNTVDKIKFEINYEEVNGELITHLDPIYEMGRVHINKTQFFQKVPKVAWEFYIGGYQPAQKWLKDRKGRTLSFEDIMHYQKIIVALFETDQLMKEIDKIDFL